MNTLTRYTVFIKSGYKLLVFILFLGLSCMSGKSQNIQLVAVGHQSTTPSAIKSSELKSIMRGETQRWKNGKRILIALMKTTTPVGETTSNKIYDMSGNELNKYWLALVFQGKATSPAFFNSAGELENFVAQNEGAIGIMDRSGITNGVKVITVDGRSQVGP